MALLPTIPLPDGAAHGDRVTWAGPRGGRLSGRVTTVVRGPLGRGVEAVRAGGVYVPAQRITSWDTRPEGDAG